MSVSRQPKGRTSASRIDAQSLSYHLGDSAWRGMLEFEAWFRDPSHDETGVACPRTTLARRDLAFCSCTTRTRGRQRGCATRWRRSCAAAAATCPGPGSSSRIRTTRRTSRSFPFGTPSSASSRCCGRSCAARPARFGFRRRPSRATTTSSASARRRGSSPPPCHCART